MVCKEDRKCWLIVKSKTKTKSLDSSNSSQTLICSVCGKEFEPNDDTKYIISGGYTCNWKCFLNESKRRDSEKKEKNKKNKKINI